MENKKTTIVLVIVIVLIIALIAVSYFYNDFNMKQKSVLTEELNKILESNLLEDDINFDIKAEKNYAKVEKAIKEYVSNIKNIYVEMEEMASGINPNSIFSAQNISEKNMDKIDEIIDDYKEKCQNLLAKYEELTDEQKISEKIENANITIRKDYYTELYNGIMQSEMMQKQFNKLEEETKNEKARIYDKLNKIEKMKTFLEEHKDSWAIENDRIHFTNINRMVEYYNLFNQVID